MKPPMFVRPLTPSEREEVERGLRARDAVTLRRCQIVLASARGERAPAIARSLGCDDQTVRTVLHALTAAGPASLRRGSSRPRVLHPAFDDAGVVRLRALLHRSPRTFGRATSLWTLELAAEVAHEQGLTASRVSGETVRATLARRGVGWKRAKRWLVSPDPAYRRKKGPATA
jgi:transposase